MTYSKMLDAYRKRLLCLPGTATPPRLRYGPADHPVLADRIELIRVLHSAPDGSYDGGEVGEAIAAEMARLDELAKTPLHKLAYEDFLDTDYWYWLSHFMKTQADYTCQRCGFRGDPPGRGLNVHHKTYEHRGSEYPDHLDDLEVLCKACHRERHNPSPGWNPDDIAW